MDLQQFIEKDAYAIIAFLLCVIIYLVLRYLVHKSDKKVLIEISEPVEGTSKAVTNDDSLHTNLDVVKPLTEIQLAKEWWKTLSLEQKREAMKIAGIEHLKVSVLSGAEIQMVKELNKTE